MPAYRDILLGSRRCRHHSHLPLRTSTCAGCSGRYCTGTDAGSTHLKQRNAPECLSTPKDTIYEDGTIVITRILDGRSGVRFPVGVREFSLFQNFQTRCGAHPTSHSKCAAAFFSGVKRPGCEVSHSPHLVSKLRMSGTIHLFLLYAFMSPNYCKV